MSVFVCQFSGKPSFPQPSLSLFIYTFVLSYIFTTNLSIYLSDDARQYTHTNTHLYICSSHTCFPPPPPKQHLFSKTAFLSFFFCFKYSFCLTDEWSATTTNAFACSICSIIFFKTAPLVSGSGICDTATGHTLLAKDHHRSRLRPESVITNTSKSFTHNFYTKSPIEFYPQLFLTVCFTPVFASYSLSLNKSASTFTKPQSPFLERHLHSPFAIFLLYFLSFLLIS